ncbi:uncharacterized protein N7482_010052 [Penicillium canariense]|uniref:Reverse transcriptase RNase H-like domain-containing protein n=1 Tax=Penicillium canariense TaxID=189055 RepID=A0A9W9LE51_9EURO|nr:uncharacterized protein N7482_010052 [Penicillium canariense]KAJ5150800.1 hypothetical protein N7482_010052 [Penicillium canariense]
MFYGDRKRKAPDTISKRDGLLRRPPKRQKGRFKPFNKYKESGQKQTLSDSKPKDGRNPIGRRTVTRLYIPIKVRNKIKTYTDLNSGVECNIVNASDHGISSILSQEGQDKRYHPITFWSRKFNRAELNYSTPDQELFAIISSFKHWRHYFKGSIYPIEVLSDHQNLRGFIRQTKLTGRQARKTNPADGLSRRINLALKDTGSPSLLLPIRDRLVTETSPKQSVNAEVQCITLQGCLANKSQLVLKDDASSEDVLSDQQNDPIPWGLVE